MAATSRERRNILTNTHRDLVPKVQGIWNTNQEPYKNMRYTDTEQYLFVDSEECPLKFIFIHSINMH